MGREEDISSAGNRTSPTTNNEGKLHTTTRTHMLQKKKMYIPCINDLVLFSLSYVSQHVRAWVSVPHFF